MSTIQPTNPTGITLLIGSPQHDMLLSFVARLALVGSVQVLVGGNRFDVHALARHIRRHTVALDETLTRVQQRRPFTAVQMVNLIETTTPTTPLVVLDLLTTFYDESLSDHEALRLLRLAVTRLREHGQKTAVFVTVRQPQREHRAGFIKLVRGVAEQVYIFEKPKQPVQPRLF